MSAPPVLSAAKFPRWLATFHELIELAQRGLLVSAEAQRSFVARIQPSRGPTAKWLETARAANLPAKHIASFNEAAVPLDAWIGDEATSIGPQIYYRANEGAVDAIGAAIREPLSGRSDEERAIAFLSYFYQLEVRSPQASADANGLATYLDVDQQGIQRLVDWATDCGYLRKRGAYYSIAREGRTWVDEQLGNVSSAQHGPWWMRADDQNQKWAKLGSRPAYDRDVERAIESASQAQPLSALFVDFDNLKALNTAHTNPVVDRSLGAVIDTIASAVHGRGRVYLHGNGDEFAVLLPNTSQNEAMATAERICAECRSLKVDPLPPPTVSIGVASYPVSATDSASLENAAAAAQVRAKQAGKDRAALAPPLPKAP